MVTYEDFKQLMQTSELDKKGRIYMDIERLYTNNEEFVGATRNFLVTPVYGSTFNEKGKGKGKGKGGNVTFKFFPEPAPKRLFTPAYEWGKLRIEASQPKILPERVKKNFGTKEAYIKYVTILNKIGESNYTRLLASIKELVSADQIVETRLICDALLCVHKMTPARGNTSGMYGFIDICMEIVADSTDFYVGMLAIFCNLKESKPINDDDEETTWRLRLARHIRYMVIFSNLSTCATDVFGTVLKNCIVNNEVPLEIFALGFLDALNKDCDKPKNDMRTIRLNGNTSPLNLELFKELNKIAIGNLSSLLKCRILSISERMN